METEQKESLSQEVSNIINEGRMVTPGIQALFGFQLIAVLQPRFKEALPPVAQTLHLAALLLVAFAIALIMAPAAYHRQVEPDRASRRFADYGSMLIAVAMAPLLFAIAIEVALVSYVVKPLLWLSACLGGASACAYVLFWYVIPRVSRLRQRSKARTEAARAAAWKR